MILVPGEEADDEMEMRRDVQLHSFLHSFHSREKSSRLPPPPFLTPYLTPNTSHTYIPIPNPTHKHNKAPPTNSLPSAQQ